MNYNKSVIETMKKRQSIRNFDTKSLSDEHIKLINEYLSNEQNLIGPFGRIGKMELILITNYITEKGIKLGTYGFIKNQQGYIVGICENETYSLVEFGYTFQKLILLLTELEIGTCWMGGTFSRKSFEKEIRLEGDEFIPCVTPIGYLAERQRVFDKALRFVVKADNKKDWSDLFYNTGFDQVLSKEAAGQFEIPIEMVRQGPSASNKQPWRLVLTEDQKACHFYIENTPNYSDKLGYKMQLLDMGIAMCQFDLACKELQIEGFFEINEPNIALPNGQFEYIATWKMN